MAADVSFLCRVPRRVVQVSIGQPHRDDWPDTLIFALIHW